MKLDSTSYKNIIQQQSVVILFGAEWDAGPDKEINASFEAAIHSFGREVKFGTIDVDQEQEIAKSVKLLQVPSVGYYSKGKLVKLIVGAHQNIEANVNELLRSNT